MTGIRGDAARRAGVPLVLATMLLLGGCATATGPGAATPTPSPTPTVACPQVEGQTLPPECAPYDPDHAMAQNDRYRERMDLDEDARVAAAQPAADLQRSLEALRASGSISVDAVERALGDAGLADPQVRGDERAVAFGAVAPQGGCVFGELRADGVAVDVGGYIMDGGCLPAQ
ncbi:hypothetical protein [Microbacterium sp. CR_7]|uniref:hypothetical protein n=1 Tax=Microbacterium sp. CR_7 TaxID=3055792 RepID=UPI0035C02320